MIMSIRMNGMYNIGVNSLGKIEVDETQLHVEKDIPFVRYNLGSYGEQEVEYVKKMQEKFIKSTHLMELTLGDNTVQEYNALRENLSVAIYVYIDITEEVVQAKELSADILNKLIAIQGCGFDRYMLKDKSETLDFTVASVLMKQLSKTLRVKPDKIGICSSPLSFQGHQCLSAVQARELMSIYNIHSDVPLPSANHECMNCCGCIRYANIESDLEAPSEKAKATTKKKETGENKESAPKKKKTSTYRPGMFQF